MFKQEGSTGGGRGGSPTHATSITWGESPSGLQEPHIYPFAGGFTLRGKVYTLIIAIHLNK